MSSLDAKIAIISTSFIYVFGFLFSAFLANRVRKIPYSPSSPFSTFLSSVVIATGVWCGTSFYDLDLSYVNFRGSNLANTDLRARKLYRTCFQGVTGLERARVDSRYLDLENPKVQKLLTEGRSEDRDFSGLNLRGAYLQNAELRRFNFTDTDLTGADMQNADLRGSLLVRAQVIGVDFTNADLTGCCIQDWSINSQTCFTDVRCEYIYRKLDEHGEPIERFPANRNFELREFESLYQEVENVVELIFKEGENWQAALFSLRKLQLEDEELGLELKSIEKRGDLWVLKVTHNNAVSKQEVENRLNASFDEMKQKLAAKEQQIDKLLDIVADQAKTLKGYSKQPLGTSNNFFIVESAITNLSGSGQIDYQEAANQVRNIVATSANSGENTSFATNLLDKFQEREVAVNPTQQTELIEQIILAEAQKDTVFKQFILLQGEQISEAMPESSISTAIRNAIAKLN
ncbi:pentapeptide repeat-containing protein [Floridanema evergladense]|uniref:Pentapeptide repeat-containing protein n=1 Tax=Floridaenema evergladense BLCC-F167 TaxID=3153639 RepID=A0ABV4WY81_9CYAN